MHDDTAEQKINFLAKQTSTALTHLQDQGDSNKTADNNLLHFLSFSFFMVHVFCLPLVREKKSFFGVVWSLSTRPWKCIASFYLFIYFETNLIVHRFLLVFSTQTQEHPLDLSGQLPPGSLLHWMPQATQLDSRLSLLNPIIKRRVFPVEAITSGPPLWAAIWTFPCRGGICFKTPIYVLKLLFMTHVWMASTICILLSCQKCMQNV